MNKYKYVVWVGGVDDYYIHDKGNLKIIQWYWARI
jgi:hypothetical protein